VTNQGLLLSTPQYIYKPNSPQSAPLCCPALRRQGQNGSLADDFALDPFFLFCKDNVPLLRRIVRDVAIIKFIRTDESGTHNLHGAAAKRMTTYELFLCWIIVMLLVLVVGEASIIKLGLTQ
jgi:hypothetical protein